ncbi:MAG: site-specific DNA-methyltransferase [Burkholderiaceae bacterium]
MVKAKLELTWIGKDARPKLEPRILLEDPARSHHAKHRVTENDLFDNRLIFGDNLLTLKALEQEFAGKVKCVYIDPPFNTGAAFEHYDDSLEHSIWLGLMRDRLQLIRKLLRPDGFLCCHIDDSEGHYLKVLLDEVFERNNYLATLYVQVRYAEKTLKQDMDFHKQVEQIHVYRSAYGAKPFLEKKDVGFEKFKFSVKELASGRTVILGGKSVTIFPKGTWSLIEEQGHVDGLKEIWATGTILDGNSSGRFFRDYLTGRVSDDGLGALYKVEGIGDDGLGYRYFTGPARATATKGKYYQGVPVAQREVDAEASTLPIENFYDLAGSFGNCRGEGGVDFRGGKKPKTLLKILLDRFSQPGDWVMDSFAGSGTTAAVAHKMRRRWITIELGDHCHTHVIPRLKKIVEGEDQSGVTEATGWKGGGGFRYYRLAPSLLQQDRWGQWVVNKNYNAEMLAAAICKLEGFTYAPSADLYWQHGHSTESDFIYVTTQSLNAEALQALSEEVGPQRTLLVCCGAFRSDASRWANLTVKKIPKMVLQKCEWGHDDYSLNVENLPQAQPSPPAPLPKGEGSRVPQAGLFDGGEA